MYTALRYVVILMTATLLVFGPSVVYGSARVIVECALSTGCRDHWQLDVAQTIQDRQPIRIALVSDLGNPDARALLVRRGPGRAMDLIVVDENSTPADLAKAVAILLRFRNSPTTKPTGEIRAFVSPANNYDSPDIEFARQELARLRNATVQPVMGFGNVPSIISPVRKDVGSGRIVRSPRMP